MSEQPRKPDDAHDPAVDAAWHRESTEGPSAPVDAAIRAAARREIGSAPDGRAARRPLARATRRWSSLAAAAAVGVLAFGVLRWLPPQQDVAPPLRPASSEQRAPVTAAESALPSRAGEPATPAPTTEDLEARQDGVSAAAAAAPPPAARDDSAAETERATSTASKVMPMREAARGSTAATRSSDEWVDDIVRTHGAGDLADAAELLRRFRAEYADADARLPETLQSWASGVVR